mgnify:CR=1 FL=1
MSSASQVRCVRDGAILWITIDRPQAMNSLNAQAHRELHEARRHPSSTEGWRHLGVVEVGNLASQSVAGHTSRRAVDPHLEPPRVQ